MNEAKYIWMNGEFVNWADAKVHILTHTLHYGNGVFEGTRAYQTEDGLAVFRLQDHTRRLLNSAKIVKIDVPFSQEELEEAQLEIFKKSIKIDDLRIKTLIWGCISANFLFPPSELGLVVVLDY